MGASKGLFHKCETVVSVKFFAVSLFHEVFIYCFTC
jgi:hypothetical protein